MNTPLNDALKPCPFCGSTDIKSHNTSIVSEYLECAKCMTEGPVAASKAEAIATWNTRASSPESNCSPTDSSAAQGAMEERKPFGYFMLTGFEQDQAVQVSDEHKDDDEVFPLFVAQPSDAIAQPRVDLTDERAAFEQWADSVYSDRHESIEFDLRTDGEYRHGLLRDLWKAWTRRALLANTAHGKPVNRQTALREAYKHSKDEGMGIVFDSEDDIINFVSALAAKKG